MRHLVAATRWLAFGLATLGLAGCGNPVDALPDPTWQEGNQALMRAVPQLTQHLVLDQSTPKECVAGKIGEEPIRSCKVCAVVVVITSGRLGGLGGLSIERGIFNMPFKRGLSFEQPDVAPVDPTSGVWVAASIGPPSFMQTKSVKLERGQIPGTEISMMRTFGGSVSYSIRSPGRLGIIANREVLKEFLSAAPAAEALAGLVGWCEPRVADE
jgi:hypothetical protein